MCCTHEYCPLETATRDWLKMGGIRLDTHWPFSTRNDSSTGKYNDYVVIAHGMWESGLRREDMFITVKSAHYSHSTLLYFTLLYFTLRYSTLLYFTLLYSTLLYFTLLYFTLLYSNQLQGGIRNSRR